MPKDVTAIVWFSKVMALCRLSAVAGPSMTRLAGGWQILRGTSPSMAHVHGRPVPGGTGPSRTVGGWLTPRGASPSTTSVAGGQPIPRGTSPSMASVRSRPVPGGTGPSMTPREARPNITLAHNRLSPMAASPSRARPGNSVMLPMPLIRGRPVPGRHIFIPVPVVIIPSGIQPVPAGMVPLILSLPTTIPVLQRFASGTFPWWRVHVSIPRRQRRSGNSFHHRLDVTFPSFLKAILLRRVWEHIHRVFRWN